MGGNDPAEATGGIEQRRRLNGAESRGRRDVPVWRELGIISDVGDHRLGEPARRPPAGGRIVVVDDREVLEELTAEPALGGDPQRATSRFAELDVAEVRAQQRDRPVEGTLEQQCRVRRVVDALDQGAHSLDHLGLIQP
jgi:hypothetical protein